jgi:hypothetical protein
MDQRQQRTPAGDSRCSHCTIDVWAAVYVVRPKTAAHFLVRRLLPGPRQDRNKASFESGPMRAETGMRDVVGRWLSANPQLPP